MNYNLLIDWEDLTEESGIEEPLTVQEVKDYLRLEGFIDNYESVSSEFDDDDTLIEDLIRGTREAMEEYTGLSFIPKTWQIEFDNYAGNFEIPFGPVIDILELHPQGESLASDELEYTTSSNKRILKTPEYGNLVMLYEAGYVTLPKRLKDAMLKEIAYRYENRGDVNVDGISKEATILASTYKTTMTWLG
jgi:uncharacterized phiE125 gp8 family phage protein